MPAYTERLVTVPAAGGLIVGPSPKRVAIIFPAPLTNRFTISLTNPPVLDQGITLYPLGIPFQFWRAYHGQATEHAFYGISAVADQLLVIGEVYE